MPRSISDASVNVFQCVAGRLASSARERSAVGNTAIRPVASACSRQPEMRRNCSPVPLPPWNMKTSGAGRARPRPARDVDDELPRMAVHLHDAAVDARRVGGAGRIVDGAGRRRGGVAGGGRGLAGGAQAERASAAAVARRPAIRPSSCTTSVGHGALPASWFARKEVPPGREGPVACRPAAGGRPEPPARHRRGAAIRGAAGRRTSSRRRRTACRRPARATGCRWCAGRGRRA